MADFLKASEFVRNMPAQVKVTDKMKLEFYAHFKQATLGNCKTHGGSQPYAIQFESRAKWDAWNALGDMDTETAKQKYVDLLKSIVPDWNTL